MSRYLILILLNIPLVLVGLLGSLIDYKTGKISRSKYAFITVIWLIILGGLIATQPVLDVFYRHHIAHRDTISLIDVIEITGIIYILFMANRSRIKLDTVERRLQDLHQELSIKLAEEDRPANRKK